MIVSPFLFNRKTKSDLGWAFIGLIDGGRVKEYADDGSDITRIYRRQLAACTDEVLPGPGKLLRVVPGTRPAEGRSDTGRARGSIASPDPRSEARCPVALRRLLGLDCLAPGC
jgi:hypothetical protein